MIRVPATALLAGVILFAGSPGIRPRSDVAEYPARENADIAAFGAAVIPSAEAKKIFAADLDKAGYVVIEVGVFPAPAREPDLSPLDFALRADPNTLSERTADAGAIAAAVAKPARSSGPEAPSEEVSATAGASVQHISYPDPVTGRKTGTTIVGVNSGAGVGKTAQSASSGGADTSRIEQQLWEKSLPDGKTTVPVAGYLYFPKPSKKAKSAAWVLEWENAGSRVKIALPNSAK